MRFERFEEIEHVRHAAPYLRVRCAPVAEYGVQFMVACPYGCASLFEVLLRSCWYAPVFNSEKAWETAL